MKLSAFTDPDVKEAQCCKQQRARDSVDSKRQQVWKGVVETRENMRRRDRAACFGVLSFGDKQRRKGL